MENIRRKIIYVDDVNYNLLTLKSRLKDKYEVFPAQSVTRLFEILNHIEPDLILLDVNMPDTDGFKAIGMLKNDNRFNSIPVIFLTAQDGQDNVYTGLNLGAVGYVKKPFSTSFLIEQIESVFNPDQYRNSSYDWLIDNSDTDKLRILAVDDVFTMLKTIDFALRDLYKVYTLARPEELKNILRNVDPDLFLLDCNMPVLSGFDLVPIIREFPEHKETPIIFITADGTVDQIKMAIGCGACDFIKKPVDIELLREKVKKHIKHR